MARVRVSEHRRRCAAIAAAWFRLRVMPIAIVRETCPGYYEHEITAASNAAVARAALERARPAPPDAFELEERARLEELEEERRHLEREPTDEELAAEELPAPRKRGAVVATNEP